MKDWINLSHLLYSPLPYVTGQESTRCIQEPTMQLGVLS